jgi:hypothetical protein
VSDIFHSRFEEQVEERDFLEAPEETDENALAQVMRQATVLIDLQEKIATKEKELKELKRLESVMNHETFPTMLQSQGLDFLGLSNGVTLKVSDELDVSVPKDETNRRTVLSWLESHGGGELIKNTLAFEDPDDEIKAALTERGIVYTEDKDVNANSLKSWFRTALGLKKNTIARIEQKEVPKEANLFLYKKTVIKGGLKDGQDCKEGKENESAED